jgi:hypothetical protein
MPSNDIMVLIGYQVESTAEWRREKAEEFPDDGRNLEAAEELDKLVEEIAKLEGSNVHRRIDALIDQTNEKKRDDIWERLHEDVSAKLRSIGFHGRPESGLSFLEWYHDRIAGALEPEEAEAEGDGVPAPNLNAEVEADASVRMARRAYEVAKKRYDEARAIALAEARKRR